MKHLRLLICFCVLFSCKKEPQALQFSEINILKTDQTNIEINMPKAEGESKASERINTILIDFVCQALHLDASKEKETSLAKSMDAFNASYADFNSLINSELQEELPVWEALIDGEVIYNDENIVCIVMNSSINTGAANSAMVLRFFNFDPRTGEFLNTKDLINDMDGFKTLVKKYYDKEVTSSYIESESLLESNTFKLPEHLGFSDEGIIILYDNFAVGAFEKEIIEFTIPFEVANAYLKI